MQYARMSYAAAAGLGSLLQRGREGRGRQVIGQKAGDTMGARIVHIELVVRDDVLHPALAVVTGCVPPGSRPRNRAGDMHHGPPARLGPLVDTKGNMLYHGGDGEIRCESRSYMDEVHVERRLAAILVADIAGYSRLMAEDEAATVATLKGHQAVVLPLVEAHGGRIQDIAGDGILAEFRSVQQAVECAIAMQRAIAERKAAVPPSRPMRFRIGVNLGDVMYDGTRAYGDGLNVAGRIQALAEPGGICVTALVREEVSARTSLAFEDLGAQHLKNIPRPVRVFHLRHDEQDKQGATTHGAPRAWVRPVLIGVL